MRDKLAARPASTGARTPLQLLRPSKAIKRSSRGGRLALTARVVANSVPEEGQEDEHRVLPAIRQLVRDDIFLFHALDKALLLHLVESAGEHPRRETGIVPENLPEPIQFQEGHVAEDEQRPLSTQVLHAFTNGIGLIRQERSDRTIRLLAAFRCHYPFGP